MKKEISFSQTNPFTRDKTNAYMEIKALGNRAVPVDAKSNFWNSGPYAFDKKEAFKIFDRSGQLCTHVIEIWWRNDGYGNRSFIYDSERAYDEYKPKNRTPHAIANEIGY